MRLLPALLVVALAMPFSSAGLTQDKGLVVLVCRFEAKSLPRQPRWQFWRHETFAIDLDQQTRYSDGSCCFIDDHSNSRTILPSHDKFYIRDKITRALLHIDRFTGEADGQWGVPVRYVRGTCKPGTRQF